MQRINNLLKGIRPEFDFATSEDFFADGMLDSFDLMTIVATLDREFGVCIEGTEIVPENFRSIKAIAGLLAKHGVQS
jgi:acyl carrier protein